MILFFSLKVLYLDSVCDIWLATAEGMCVCVCVCVRARARVCVCVCVYEYMCVCL